MQELAERQVPIEINISSNLRTGCCRKLEEHPVRRYFDEGLMITLNSDDPAMFGSWVANEYQIARDNFGFTDEQKMMRASLLALAEQQLAADPGLRPASLAEEKLKHLKTIDSLTS